MSLGIRQRLQRHPVFLDHRGQIFRAGQAEAEQVVQRQDGDEAAGVIDDGQPADAVLSHQRDGGRETLRFQDLDQRGRHDRPHQDVGRIQAGRNHPHDDVPVRDHPDRRGAVHDHDRPDAPGGHHSRHVLGGDLARRGVHRRGEAFGVVGHVTDRVGIAGVPSS